MSDIIVEFKNVSKTYGGEASSLTRKKLVRALDDVSFSIRRGMTFAVIGESGSGKSTMANLLMRFEKPSAGEILVDGRSITQLRTKAAIAEYHRTVQIVHQDPTSSLNPRKTVKEIIEEPLIVHKRGGKEERLAKVKELLDVVQLPQTYLNRYPHMLSGGQKQRIGIARAISLNSPLIILDEPTSALDVSVQSKVMELLESIKREFTITYFFITHDLALVKNFADSVIILQLGKLVEKGSVDDIFLHPHELYTKRLLKAIAVVDPAEQEFLDRIHI